jgi:hypothetical protein
MDIAWAVVGVGISLSLSILVWWLFPGIFGDH